MKSKLEFPLKAIGLAAMLFVEADFGEATVEDAAKKDDLVGRVSVIYRGSVQGVGFRYTARSIARGYAVTGYVRNLVDGSVELVAEGSVSEIRGMLASLESEMGQYIGVKEDRWGKTTGEFWDFRIAF